MQQPGKYQKLVKNNFLFKLYLLKMLPLGYFTGLRVQELNNEKCTVTVRYKWLNKNPFNSLYFGCMAMASEMSTGILMFDKLQSYMPHISFIIVNMQGNFTKKAKGKVNFTCIEQGIIDAAEQSKQNKQGTIIDLKSVGLDEAGDTVAEFIFSWSIKVKE